MSSHLESRFERLLNLRIEEKSKQSAMRSQCTLKRWCVCVDRASVGVASFFCLSVRLIKSKYHVTSSPYVCLFLSFSLGAHYHSLPSPNWVLKSAELQLRVNILVMNRSIKQYKKKNYRSNVESPSKKSPHQCKTIFSSRSFAIFFFSSIVPLGLYFIVKSTGQGAQADVVSLEQISVS